MVKTADAAGAQSKRGVTAKVNQNDLYVAQDIIEVVVGLVLPARETPTSGSDS
ncbi:MAG: hypothetical protein ACSLEW_07615 [Nocardioides sp.]